VLVIKKGSDPLVISPVLLEGSEWFRKSKTFLADIQKEAVEFLSQAEKEK
jgi:hypothetical protein